MYMTDSEICKDYREARYKKQQISILADRNLCSERQIEEVLSKNGIELPVRKKKAKEPETEEEEQEMPEAVYQALRNRLSELDELISKANREYREIAQFLGMRGTA